MPQAAAAALPPGQTQSRARAYLLFLDYGSGERETAVTIFHPFYFWMMAVERERRDVVAAAAVETKERGAVMMDGVCSLVAGGFYFGDV